MPEYVLVVDIGGTQIRAALCSLEGRIVSRVDRPTPSRQASEEIFGAIAAALRSVWPGSGAVKAVGVAFPGPLDARRGVILHSPNIPSLDGFPLVERLEAEFHLPVRLNDDANAAALAEHRFGAGVGRKHLVYLTISTGVGNGLIVDNRLVVGSAGLAGEAGHMVIASDSPYLCGCGNRGCLESLISGPALALQARLELQAGRESILAGACKGNYEQVTAKMIHEAALQGDALSVEIFARAGRHLGIAVINLLLLFNPEMVIVGGSVSKAGELLLGPCWEVVRQRCMSFYWKNLEIVPAALGDDVGLLGAYCLIQENG